VQNDTVHPERFARPIPQPPDIYAHSGLDQEVFLAGVREEKKPANHGRLPWKPLTVLSRRELGYELRGGIHQYVSKPLTQLVIRWFLH